jgi:hypothetical protein
MADFDENVGKRPIDKDVTPSYFSPSSADLAAGRRRRE